MNELQLARAWAVQGEPAWWYVRPQLLAWLGMLLLICVAVWLVTRIPITELASVSAILRAEGTRLIGAL